MTRSATATVPTRNPVVRLLLRWLGGLRFPQLFLVFAGLFVVDFVIPDLIPFVDEILLGLATLLLASLRNRREDRPIDVTPRSGRFGRTQ
jgi:Family of unknown function (DUF6116)